MNYKTMSEVAEKLKKIIDGYWRLDISEKKLIAEIAEIFNNTDNRGLVMRGPKFKAGFERKLGKKRIEELIKVLKKVDNGLFKALNE